MLVNRTFVDLFRHISLLRRQAVRRFRGSTRDRGGIKRAGKRVADQTVSHPVKLIACSYDRIVQHREGTRRQDFLSTAVQINPRDPGMLEGVEKTKVHGRSTSDDAIEFGGITLGLHQSFATPIGAARKVGIRWAASI